MKSNFSWHTEHCEVVYYIGISPVSNNHTKDFIYLKNKYLQIHHTKNLHFFLLFRKPEMLAIATLCFVSNSDGNWISLPKAPFGGVIPNSRLEKNEVIFLLTSAENFIKNHGGEKIIMISPPEKYDVISNGVLQYCYAKEDYIPVKHQRNHFITVTEKPFEARIKTQELRRLKKCVEAGFKVIQETDSQAVAAFNAMKLMREELGYTTSITSAEFKKLLEVFPGQIRLFTVYDSSKPIAVSITVRVNERVIYSFLSGYEKGYRQFSPTIMLLKKAYEICQDENIAILDLGISVDHHGYEKSSLIRFKENLGAQECRKITWEKVLDYL